MHYPFSPLLQVYFADNVCLPAPFKMNAQSIVLLRVLTITLAGKLAFYNWKNSEIDTIICYNII